MKSAATAAGSPTSQSLRKNSAKAPNGRRNRLPHHGRSNSCSEVGQAVSPVGSQSVRRGASKTQVSTGRAPQA
jgi:hypothetical protein